MFEQHISIRMISERSGDTEDWSNDAENYNIYIYIYIYSGAKKYLVSHQLCKFFHLKRWERPVIFIIGIPQLWETK